jgi:hypothetical protein
MLFRRHPVLVSGLRIYCMIGYRSILHFCCMQCCYVHVQYVRYVLSTLCDAACMHVNVKDSLLGSSVVAPISMIRPRISALCSLLFQILPTAARSRRTTVRTYVVALYCATLQPYACICSPYGMMYSNVQYYVLQWNIYNGCSKQRMHAVYVYNSCIFSGRN